MLSGIDPKTNPPQKDSKSVMGAVKVIKPTKTHAIAETIVPSIKQMRR